MVAKRKSRAREPQVSLGKREASPAGPHARVQPKRLCPDPMFDEAGEHPVTVALYTDNPGPAVGEKAVFGGAVPRLDQLQEQLACTSGPIHMYRSLETGLESIADDGSNTARWLGCSAWASLQTGPDSLVNPCYSAWLHSSAMNQQGDLSRFHSLTEDLPLPSHDWPANVSAPTTTQGLKLPSSSSDLVQPSQNQSQMGIVLFQRTEYLEDAVMADYLGVPVPQRSLAVVPYPRVVEELDLQEPASFSYTKALADAQVTLDEPCQAIETARPSEVECRPADAKPPARTVVSAAKLAPKPSTGEPMGTASSAVGPLRRHIILPIRKRGSKSSGPPPINTDEGELRLHPKPFSGRERRTCLRCKDQKLRCEPDPLDFQGACLACRDIKNTRKWIYRFPCTWLRLALLTLYRSGGLRYTRRWQVPDFTDIVPIDINEVHVIHISNRAFCKPLAIAVTRFAPEEGDELVRVRHVREGDKIEKIFNVLGNWCLKNLRNTTSDMMAHLSEYATEAFFKYQREIRSASYSQVIRETYAMAIERYIYLRDKYPDAAPSSLEYTQRSLLEYLMYLWHGMRHMTGSSWITGDDDLGIEKSSESTDSIHGKPPVPRLIVAQFDNLINIILNHWKRHVMLMLEKLVLSRSPKVWITVYIVVFLFLGEASYMTQDRARHAKDNRGPGLRYTVGSFVEELHHSCNILLVHWKYFNCHQIPQRYSKTVKKGNNGYPQLSKRQLETVNKARSNESILRHLEVWDIYKKENGRLTPYYDEKHPRPKAANGFEYIPSKPTPEWDDDFYWIAQMFDKDWCPHATYVREEMD